MFDVSELVEIKPFSSVVLRGNGLKGVVCPGAAG